MPNRETSVANWWETTLSSQMGPADLFADVITTSGLSTPTLVVIEGESATQREVVLFDGTFSATRFSTASIANRYQAGSAAASGLTHPVGSSVRSVVLAQHYQDVNDRVDGHTHAGGADGNTINYSNLAGLPIIGEVEASAEVAQVAGVGSYQAVASVTLPIPSGWAEWRCAAYASLVGYTGTAIVTSIGVSIDGVDQQRKEFVMRVVAPTDGFPLSVGGHRTGITTTGNRTVSLMVASTSGPNEWYRDIYLYARAVRTA